MTKHEADVIGGLNMTDQISNEAYKKIMIAAQDENEVGEVLDEIKADIEQTTSRYCLSIEHSALGHVVWSDRLIKESEVLEIIDKYKAEGSESDGNND